MPLGNNVVPANFERETNDAEELAENLDSFDEVRVFKVSDHEIMFDYTGSHRCLIFRTIQEAGWVVDSLSSYGDGAHVAIVPQE